MLSKDLMPASRGAANRRPGVSRRYAVLYVRGDAPQDLLLEEVRASNLAAALTTARQRFPDATILRVRRSRTPVDVAAYPDARFIRGRFLPATFDDDPALRALGE